MKVKEYTISTHPKDIIGPLFNKGLAAVPQVSESKLGAFEGAFRDSGFRKQCLHRVVKTSDNQTISIDHGGNMIYDFFYN